VAGSEGNQSRIINEARGKFQASMRDADGVARFSYGRLQALMQAM
jgi:hypothetical protein